jgi:hypothetical protein
MRSIEETLEELDARIGALEEDLEVFCRDGEEDCPEAGEAREILDELRDLRLWILA